MTLCEAFDRDFPLTCHRKRNERKRLIKAAQVAAEEAHRNGITDRDQLEAIAHQAMVDQKEYGSVAIWLGLIVLGEIVKWIVARLLERWASEDMGS